MFCPNNESVVLRGLIARRICVPAGPAAPEWQMMIDAQQAGVPVVAVVNPGSGPGTEGDRPSYERGMKALRDCGVEV